MVHGVVPLLGQAVVRGQERDRLMLCDQQDTRACHIRGTRRPLLDHASASIEVEEAWS